MIFVIKIGILPTIDSETRNLKKKQQQLSKKNTTHKKKSRQIKKIIKQKQNTILKLSKKIKYFFKITTNYEKNLFGMNISFWNEMESFGTTLNSLDLT